jgi:GT2 family glycosyltransferase
MLLFTDDDCIPEQDWAERMCMALEQQSIVAGVVASPSSNYIKLCHNIAEFHRFMPGCKGGNVDFVAGANMGIARSLLEELGGFQEGRVLAGDMELVLRARVKGYRVHLASDAMVTHDPERTDLRTVLGYAAEHASTTILLRNEYRSLLRTPFVLRSSVLVLLAAPLIALKVTLGIYLANSRLARLFWTLPLVYALKLAWCWGAARGLREQKRAGI